MPSITITYGLDAQPDSMDANSKIASKPAKTRVFVFIDTTVSCFYMLQFSKYIMNCF